MRTNTRRYLLTLMAAVALVGSGLGVAALAQPDAGDMFTGCLNENSGVLRNVAVGFEPAETCNPQELQITWDLAGPAFEGRIAALEERVAELEEPFGSLEVFVDCDAGDTVGAALDQAQTHIGPVNIVVSGICEETIAINRDDVTVSGQYETDGLRGPFSGDAGATVSIGASHRVRLLNMTVMGGADGIAAGTGASFEADGVTVRDVFYWGIRVDKGASANLRNCTVENATNGGVAAFGGSVDMSYCTTTGNGVGLWAAFGGTISAWNVDVVDNLGNGVFLFDAASLWINDSRISNNVDFGIHAMAGAMVSVENGSIVANNGAVGVQASVGSSLRIGGQSLVEGNSGGINANGASTAWLQSVTIQGNTYDGVVLEDQSLGASGRPGPVIVDNGGFGINCAGPPGFPIVQSRFDFTEIQFAGNTNGGTNCP